MMPESGGSMKDVDILSLVERLENLAKDARHVPFLHGKVMVDEQEFFQIVELIRFVVPEEVREARRILQQRDRILSNAKEEADRMRSEAQNEASKLIAQAKEHARYLIEQNGLLEEARHEAEEIVKQAQHEADRYKLMAQEYAREVLLELEEILSKKLNSIRLGIEHLNQPR